jgi:lipopolysaccharide transport system ATP-binding protein
MTTTVIHGESLGKRYRRGLHAEPGLRHAIENFVRSPLSVFRGNNQESFWALKDVSFEVREGEVVGLIGRNGAGKTTLLKILSRITRPTTGWAEIRGRVGSLLEVGTGFHPELTGRENTFLSGAILGMSKKEIERKFDEIVAFAELEKFIDTQVKHYSSGMFVRLAFAVAAHLEPEILLVDEVLAVGDINFQKKCLGKMGDVARTGRTVILVSHNLGAIGQLCHRTISIEQGMITADGPTEITIANYLRSVVGAPNVKNWERTGTGRVRFQSIEVCEKDGTLCAHTQMGKDVYIRVAGNALQPETEFTLAVQLVSLNGTPVVWIYDQFRTFSPNAAREFLIEVRIPQLMLMPGSYFVHAWLGRPSQEEFDYVKNAASFEVVQSERIPVTIEIQSYLGLTYAPLEAKQLQ